MMFNQDGGLVLNKDGYVIREWMWSSKGKLDDPVEIWVNKFITVKISGRFAVTLVYKWQPQSLTLSLAPVRHKSFPPCLPEAPSSLMHPADTLHSAMDMSPMSDVATVTKLRSLQKKVKCLLFQWLDHYRFAFEVGSPHISRILELPQKVVRKQRVSSVNVLLEQKTKEINTDKEYLRFRNTFLELKGTFKPSPVHCTQKTPTSNRSYRLPLFFESSDVWFASQLDCPVVLRKTLCGKEGFTCRCSALSIPEVTDLEYDYLINKRLSSMDQIIIVCVFSPSEKDKAIKEMAHIHRELNRSRNMPCIQSRLDPFRLLKYNIVSASKFTGSNCPLLVQRHNVIPGIFLQT
ncbi:uncharacterized protein C3orf20 homolog [Elephas maximus indicus]|uniref:uncharacterized protein C3orf20 homolog n=1 Tax=Elephas maximus indicus TaxID=99487 RepID=UPI0021161313|nr:uncharacterized protein C3orf20 homolog [Elephas maximus indicus]